MPMVLPVTFHLRFGILHNFIFFVKFICFCSMLAKRTIVVLYQLMDNSGAQQALLGPVTPIHGDGVQVSRSKKIVYQWFKLNFRKFCMTYFEVSLKPNFCPEYFPPKNVLTISVDDHAHLEDCNCPNDEWSCTNTATCSHPNRCEYTVIPGNRPVGKCVPEPRECECYGDPHCQSFDNVVGHFIGLGEFRMTRNTNPHLPKFEVRMHTRADKTGFIEWVCVDFESKSAPKTPITICVDHENHPTVEYLNNNHPRLEL